MQPEYTDKHGQTWKSYGQETSCGRNNMGTQWPITAVGFTVTKVLSLVQVWPYTPKFLPDILRVPDEGQTQNYEYVDACAGE